MAELLDKAEIEIPCSKCGRKTKKSVGWLKSLRSFTCGCGTRVEIDARQMNREVAKIEAQLRKLRGR